MSNFKWIVFIMTVYTVALSGILYAFFALDVANAKLSLKTTGPAPGAKKSEYVNVLGSRSNADSTQTLVIVACGTFLELTVDPEDLQTQNPEIQTVLMKAIKLACEGK